METKNIKQRNLIAGVLFGAVVISVMFLGAGCAGKKSNSANGYLTSYNYGSPGYGGYGTVAKVGGGVEIQGNYYVLLAASIQGGAVPSPAIVSGELRIYRPMACQNPQFGLNPGTYQLVPLDQQTPAQLDFNAISYARFMAQGPGGQAIISVPQAFFFGNYLCGYEGIKGFLKIETVSGGAPCNLQTNFTDTLPGFCV